MNRRELSTNSRAMVVLLGLGVVVASMAGCSSGRTLTADATPPVGMLSGCYIDVYDRYDHSGKAERFWGPAIYSTLNKGKHDWSKRISSVTVGPGAHVKLAAKDNLEGQAIWLGPGKSVSDLRTLNFDEKAQSIEIVPLDKARMGSEE
jgi:hypothetical protein